MFTFVSNNPADFTGGADKTTRAGSFRADRVSHAIEMSGDVYTPKSVAMHSFAPVPGDVTWCHARVGFFGSQYSAPQDHSNSDGQLFFEALDASGTSIFEFTLVNGKLRIRAYGSSTVDSADYSLANIANTSLDALDVRCDLSGGNITVDAWHGAVDNSAPPILSVSVANSAVPKTNPVKLIWRAYDAADHSGHNVYQQISEVMVGDEDTRGLGLTDLMTFGAGTYADWLGDPAMLTDEDYETGINTTETAKKLSRAIAGYTGPSSASVRGMFIPVFGSAAGGVGDARVFLRDIAGATDYSSAALGLTGTSSIKVVEFANNPVTGLPWNVTDLVNFEYGVESIA